MTSVDQAILICMAIMVIGFFINIIAINKHQLTALSLFLMSISALVGLGIIIGHTLST